MSIQSAIPANVEVYRSKVPFKSYGALHFSSVDGQTSFKIALFSTKFYDKEPDDSKWNKVKVALNHHYWVILKVYDIKRHINFYAKVYASSLKKELSLNTKIAISDQGNLNLTDITRTVMLNHHLIEEVGGIRLRQLSSGDLSNLCDEETGTYSTRETSKIY